MNNNIETLKTMKAELEQRIKALDSAISILENITPDFEASTPVLEEKKTRKKRVRNTTFESAVDITKVPDYNAYGKGGIRTDL